jgi:hypothetical protein
VQQTKVAAICFVWSCAAGRLCSLALCEHATGCEFAAQLVRDLSLVGAVLVWLRLWLSDVCGRYLHFGLACGRVMRLLVFCFVCGRELLRSSTASLVLCFDSFALVWWSFFGAVLRQLD